MNHTKQLKKSILNVIVPYFSDCVVCEEYNEETLYQAKKHPIICMTLKEILFQNGVFENLIDCKQTSDITTLTYGKPAKIKIEFFLYAKPNKKEFYCDELFDRLADCLLFQSDLQIEQLTREQLCFKPSFERYELKASVIFQTALTKELSQIPLKSADITISAQHKKEAGYDS